MTPKQGFNYRAATPLTLTFDNKSRAHLKKEIVQSNGSMTLLELLHNESHWEVGLGTTV